MVVKKNFKILKNFVKNACFLFFDMVLCLSTQPMKLIKKLVLGLGLQHILSEIWHSLTNFEKNLKIL